AWRDVDFARGTLVVMKSKNRERRALPLNNTVYALLAGKQAACGQSEGLVFTTSAETPLKARYVVRGFSNTRTRAGIPDFRFHDLRHTFGTRLAQKSVELYKIQRLSGHKTAMMTQRYTHHSPESLRDGVNVLDPTLRSEEGRKSDTVGLAKQQREWNLLN
ncbi:MAG: site-specific integrase, partial [Nitrospirota bacterium]